MPELPTSGNPPVIAPARVISSGSHNNEGPELYAIHPHRLFTVGRAVATGADISLGVHTTATSGFASENSGWNYGINAYALTGASASAAAQLIQRATTPPAQGYRFPGFAPHEQDFDPSADHFANMNRALQDMLLQSGEDGFTNATIVIFPAWPCGWDVDFSLVGPGNTTVSVVYTSGQLVSLVVDPSTRASAIRWASCVNSTTLW